MTDRPLDQWRDRMVAALCGELSELERQELEQALAGSEELRRDWQELGEVRALLRAIRPDEDDGGVGFELPPQTALRPPATQRGAWRGALASAAGFLFAVLLFGGLMLAGLRIDRTPGGVQVGFGRETGPDPRLQAASARAVAQEQQEYLTRDEFITLARALVGVTAARLDELERRQSVTQTETARLLFQALATRQQRQFDDLRSRLQLASLRPAKDDRRAPGNP
jgi:anti-sigma factor RsiW